jgi:hypothetical protein
MVQTKSKKTIILAGAIFIVAVFIIDKAILSGFRRKLSDIKRETVLVEKNFKKALMLQSRSEQISKRYKEYLSYIKIGDDDRSIIANFLREIEKITQASKISLTNLNPDNEPTKEEYGKTFKADLRFETSLDQLLDFLKRIQESPLLIRVERISVTARDESAEVLRAEATLSMSLPAP